MNILITGGAGFIGSVVTELLLSQQHRVCVLDNLSNGYRENVPEGAIFYEADIALPTERDKDVFRSAFMNKDLVIHCAAVAGVDEDPDKCMKVNLSGGMNVLGETVKRGITKFINSSSAAVYGIPEFIPIKEKDGCKPINDYGLSKLLFEHMLDMYSRRHGIDCTTFRYFNVVGATDVQGENRRKETHLIPNILNAFVKGEPFEVYGITHDTRDGTCIRDYIHVYDVAQYIVHAIDMGCPQGVYNLGSQSAFTVKEIIDMTSKITGIEGVAIARPARKEDPPILIADMAKTWTKFELRPAFTITEMIEHQWEWMQRKGHCGRRIKC